MARTGFARLVTKAWLALAIGISERCFADPEFERAIDHWLYCTECDAAVLYSAQKLSQESPAKLEEVLRTVLSDDALHLFDVELRASRTCAGNDDDSVSAGGAALRKSLIERWKAIDAYRSDALKDLTCESFVASYLAADRDNRIVRMIRLLSTSGNQEALGSVGETIKRYQGIPKPSQFVIDAYQEAISPVRQPP